jgi:hypothetical protein
MARADWFRPGGANRICESQQTHRSDRAGLARNKQHSALNPEISSRSLAPVRNLLVLDHLPLIETAEAGALHCRDVDENILAAALRLNKSIPLLRVEPLHGAFYLLQWN